METGQSAITCKSLQHTRRTVRENEVGEIAGPIETDEHIFIMKLTDKTDKEVKSLPEVQKEIQKTIIAERNRAEMEK
jgi:parvulin-like peptidyl-prolyl isomerase